MALKRMEAVICGQVQGVGFRFFTARMADLLEVTGWVCNLPDGTVKVVAVGEVEKINDFLLTLKEGSHLSQVSEVKETIESVDFNEFDSFEIRLH